MQIDINIEGIVAESVAAALAPEKIQPIIQANLDKAVKDAIEEQFSYRSPFREMLKEKMAAVMPADIEDIGRYGDLVLKTVKAIIADCQHSYVKQTIEEKMAEILKPIPATMKLSELVDRLTSFFREDFDREHSDYPTFIVERSTGSTSEYWHFYADPRGGRSKYSCKIQMAFNGEGTCYSLKADEGEIEKKLLIGPCYGAEALVLNLYTGGVKVELDRDDFEDAYYGDSLGD